MSFFEDKNTVFAYGILLRYWFVHLQKTEAIYKNLVIHYSDPASTILPV